MYTDLFWDVLSNSTLLPVGSDAPFYAMLTFDGYDTTFTLITTILAAIAGHMLNFAFGWFISSWQKSGITVLPEEKYNLWCGRMAHIVPLLGLFSWVPLLGGVGIAAGGFFRASPWVVLCSLLIGQGGYYTYQYLQLI